MVATKTMSGEIRRLTALLKRRNAMIQIYKEDKITTDILLKEKDVRLTDQCESLMRLDDTLEKAKTENADLRTEGQTQEKENRKLKERVRSEASYLTQIEMELAEADQALGRMTRTHARIASSVTLKNQRYGKFTEDRVHRQGT